MPTISVPAKNRSPKTKFDQDLLDAIDQGEPFKDRALNYNPRLRMLEYSGIWLVKFDQKGNVEDVNIKLFCRNPTYLLAKRLNVFGVGVRAKNQRPMLKGRFIDHDPEYKTENIKEVEAENKLSRQLARYARKGAKNKPNLMADIQKAIRVNQTTAAKVLLHGLEKGVLVRDSKKDWLHWIL